MLDLTRSWFGYLSLTVFVIGYLLVILEETTKMRKSKPVLMAAGLIWAALLTPQGKYLADFFVGHVEDHNGSTLVLDLPEAVADATRRRLAM